MVFSRIWDCLVIDYSPALKAIEGVTINFLSHKNYICSYVMFCIYHVLNTADLDQELPRLPNLPRHSNTSDILIKCLSHFDPLLCATRILNLHFSQIFIILLYHTSEKTGTTGQQFLFTSMR